MPEIALVLAVLVAALTVAGVGALAIADLTVAPARRLEGPVTVMQEASSRAVRATARRGAVALLIALVALIALTTLSNVLLRGLVGDAVFASPLLAAAAGVTAYAALQSRPLLARPAAAASLTARRTQDFAQRRFLVATGALGGLLLALAVLSLVTTPAVAAFSGSRVLVLLVSFGALLAASVFALRRIAVRAALPASIGAMDVAIRQIASRFVLLLSSSATLATAALIALQTGVWLWTNTPVLLGATPIATILTAAGAVVTIVGALAAIGSLATVIAAVSATAKHGRTSARATQSSAVSATA